MQTKLTNVQMQPLMKDMAPHAKLTLAGAGNVDLQVTTSGSSGDDIIRHLNGTGHLALANGVLQGIDIPYQLDNASALVRRESPTRTNTN